MPTIHVKPFGRSLEAGSGAILRDVLQGAGILLDYPCGGKGTCRQCRVVVDPPPAAGKGKLKDSESAGRRAACLPASGDGGLHGHDPGGAAFPRGVEAGSP